MKRLALALTAVALLIGATAAPADGAARKPRPRPVTISAAVWQPAAHTEWQWYLAGPLHTGNAKQMGTGKTAYDGTTSPASDPEMYDIDGIENTPATVSTLHSLGKRAVCYVEVGTAGSYYSAVDEGVSVTYFDQLKAAGALGKTLSGYAAERFVNINDPQAVTIEEAQIREQCAAKGFDAVETDLDETFNDNEGSTGFTISQADEQNYLATLADYMHSLGLAWIAKNPDDTGAQSFADFTATLAQGVISEQCNQYRTCALLSAYAASDKPVFNAEYSLSTARFCPADTGNVNGVKFTAALSGSRTPCR